MKNIIIIFLISISILQAQKTNHLEIGTNLTGISDWSTEMPFVDLMHCARIFMTQNYEWVSGGENLWDTGVIEKIPKDENGYPLSLPIAIHGTETLQIVHTIWASLAGWPEGIYPLLYDGVGYFEFSGNLYVISKESGIIKLNFTRPQNEDGYFSLKIIKSLANDHIRNIRLLMPGTELSYKSMPYNEEWINKLKQFKALRFMDWGHTNNWGFDNSWEVFDEDSDSVKVDWSKRAEYSNYTWTTSKGVPYEVMIDVCNRTQKDMWICVPFNASDNYIKQLALLLKNQLDPSLKVYVEYSNEIWNWMFGQTHWLQKFGCLAKGKEWPEGIVPYIQNCMDIFSEVFSDEMNRITRVVSVQAGWLDVSKRITFNMRQGSFDAFSVAAYFGLDSTTDAYLDGLGNAATVSDLTFKVRRSRLENEMNWFKDHKNEIGKVLNIPMIYYEGGQHLTPHPFGEEPTYSKVLIDIQRDTSMYNLYTEWFNLLEELADDGNSLFMNFSFVAPLSARYGSWGILESIIQDTNVVPAPKYRAILNYINSTTDVKNLWLEVIDNFNLFQNYPNPFNPITKIEFELPVSCHVNLEVYSIAGELITKLAEGERASGYYNLELNSLKYNLSSGVYIYRLRAVESLTEEVFTSIKKMVLLK